MNRLTKGSRFYTFSPFVLIAAFALSWKLEEAAAFIAIATTWMLGAGSKSAIGTLKGNGS